MSFVGSCPKYLQTSNIYTMKTFFVILFTFTQIVSFSQEVRLHLKKLSKEEIDLKIYEPYPNAPAVILYDIGEMYYDINSYGENLFLFQKRHVRIKILNEEGLKFAKMSFIFNNMNCEQLIGEISYNLKGFTHNTSEKGIISSKLKNNSIQIRDSLNCIQIADVIFPDVKVGSIIEYVLIIPSLKMINPDTWYFEKNLPVIYSEFNAYVPDDFKYLFSLKNVDETMSVDSTFYDHLIDYKYRNGNAIMSSKIILSGKKFKFVKTNIPILESPSLAQKLNIHLKYVRANPHDYAWEKLTRQLMITTWDDYNSRTPNQRKMLPFPPAYFIYYLPSWNESFAKLQKSDRFGQALIKFWDCDSIIKLATKNKENDFDKAEAIYLFVKEHMKWNGQYSLYADVSDNVIKSIYGKIGAKVKLNSIGNYFEKGIGNSAEINFIFMYLVNKTDINISPVLVNLKQNEQVDRNISDINQFISVIALLEIDGKKMLIDAAEPGSSFYSLSDKYDLEQMLIFKNDSFEWYMPD